ncbi:MAG: hypothetical protein JXR25_07095 [Pontiellaceae bacterium]|nr:hypothetical protein [Pontiellaceae bacterium]MBN2784577.1 hypothetical protein [Pontiellaceae bacterium]
MPIDIKKTKDGYGVIITGHGLVTDQEYKNVFKKHLTRDPSERKGQYYSIADWSSASSVKVSAETIRFIANIARRHTPKEPPLIISTVADKDHIFGLARMGHTLKQDIGWHNSIFRTRKEAEEWVKETMKNLHGMDELDLRTK